MHDTKHRAPPRISGRSGIRKYNDVIVIVVDLRR
jgi:hypothetical protein